MGTVQRRNFLVATAALFGVPLIAKAQAPRKIARIGVTMAGSSTTPYLGALREGLKLLGWVEGKNIQLEVRYAEGRLERYPDFMAEFVRLKVDVIVCGGGTRPARAAMQATTTIPIVVPATADPVGSGLVASLAQPGGNVTGLSMIAPEASAKRVQLIGEVAPGTNRIAVLSDPAVDAGQISATVAASKSMRLQPHIVTASRTEELVGALTAAVNGGAQFLIVLSSSFFNEQRRELVKLAAQNNLPAIYEHGEFVRVGGLMSYGPDLPGMYKQSAAYVDRILRGARPATLPVEQVTKFEMVINTKTAKELRLTIPPAVLVRADRVVE